MTVKENRDELECSTGFKYFVPPKLTVGASFESEMILKPSTTFVKAMEAEALRSQYFQKMIRRVQHVLANS